MKTPKEIKNYRRKCEEIRKELERVGIGDPCLTAFLSALDWVLMPSNSKKIKKKSA